MTVDKDFYYPRKTESFLTATRGWPWKLAAFYSIFLDVVYQLEGTVPDDLDEVRTWVGIDLKPKEWSSFRDALIERGKLTRDADGRLHNPIADRWFAKRSMERNAKPSPNSPENAKKPVENAGAFTPRADGKKSSGNKERPPELPLDEASPPARARNSQSQSHSQTVDVGMVEVMEAAKAISEILNQPKGRYWEADIRRMGEEGITIEALTEAARAHRGDPIRGLGALRGLAARKQQDLDWKHKVERPGGVVGGAVTPSSHTDAEWEKALASLLRLGIWDAPHFGACPTRPGHVVPPGPYGRWHALWMAQGAHPLSEGDTSGNIVPYPAERVSPMLRGLWEPTAT